VVVGGVTTGLVVGGATTGVVVGGVTTGLVVGGMVDVGGATTGALVVGVEGLVGAVVTGVTGRLLVGAVGSSGISVGLLTPGVLLTGSPEVGGFVSLLGIDEGVVDELGVSLDGSIDVVSGWMMTVTGVPSGVVTVEPSGVVTMDERGSSATPSHPEFALELRMTTVPTASTATNAPTDDATVRRRRMVRTRPRTI
jgi:hypothetical protein